MSTLSPKNMKGARKSEGYKKQLISVLSLHIIHLYTAYINYQKVLDSVQHSWLLK
jgi:hypothetical protein